MRLIDANELKIDFGFTWDDIAPTREEMFEIIDRQPTAEPKTGHWLRYDIDGEPNEVDTFHWQCDQCLCTEHGRRSIPWRFCPNCGAKMEGGEADG